MSWSIGMSVVEVLGCRYSAWRDPQQVRDRTNAVCEGAGRCLRGHDSPVCRMFRARGRPPWRAGVGGTGADLLARAFFPECGGISSEKMIEQTRVTGLVNTRRTRWVPVAAGRRHHRPHLSFTWYRGSPIGRDARPKSCRAPASRTSTSRDTAGSSRWARTRRWVRTCARSASVSRTTSSSGRSASPRSRFRTRATSPRNLTRQSIVNSK